MAPSIRTFLLINLLLSVALITSIAILGNLFLEHKDIQKQMDAQLFRSSLQLQALFSDGLEHRDLNQVQQNIEMIFQGDVPAPASATHPQHAAQKNLSEKMSFQIWDAKGQLLLHALQPDHVSLSNGNPGFSSIWIQERSWRVYTSYNPANQLTIMVAERADFRQELENQLTQDSIFIMLLAYPFLGLLIWVIVGRGLEPLKKVTSEVRNRAPGHLEPVDLEVVPAEIEPLVKELNRLFDRLKDAFIREKRFAADAAHELRTPMAALRAQAQVALRAQNDAERRDALQKVLTSVDRSTHVVAQLLTLSRMMPEAMNEQQADVDLCKPATEMCADLAPQALEKSIDLELIAPEPVFIRGHAIPLSILMRNLIDNAIRYTPPQGTITVRVYPLEKNAIFSVTDTGPGIPEKLRERVFERFFRIVGNQASGSGLGLGIVQQIAKLHGAEVQLLTPENGIGLEIRVLFPPQPVRGDK